MSFTKHTAPERATTIKLVTSNGNVVAYLNLSNKFTKAVLSTATTEATLDDVNSINHGDFEAYIKQLTVVVEDNKPSSIPVEEY